MGLTQARSGIQARYDSLDQGFRKRRPEVLNNLLTKDFSALDAAGKTFVRSDALTSFRSLMMKSKNAKWPRAVDSIRQDGADFATTVHGHFTGWTQGPDKKYHKTDLTSTVEDIWVYTSKTWEIRKSKILKMALMRDGKPVKL